MVVSDNSNCLYGAHWLLANKISFVIACQFCIDQSDVSSIFWYSTWYQSFFHYKTGNEIQWFPV